ncbi:Aste57867_394 [Aphanomyces stellatus]|uniref:Aste57867_394 protein n=1 Tax=Aphanomyces stellatus TaxID=120398 RepID=A0A485K2P2_9STRA|nr:hypothetical protein As57867_000393 [Aphanomyces stellatus]VFT77619.1 Aste57867_394 [Aphanomyces stellatus]
MPGAVASGTTDDDTIPSPQSNLPHVYYIESGFLAVGNLVRPDSWVKDEHRRHCNICMQQFHAFRRRHHCRTCGEVLCNSCSKHKKIRLVELNHDLTVRICTFCIMQATDATRDVRRRSKSSAGPVAKLAMDDDDPAAPMPPMFGAPDAEDIPDPTLRCSSVAEGRYTDMTWRLTSSQSMCPAWPPTVDESAAMSKLDHERHADTFCPYEDNTLNVLVHLVANSLYCHMVAITLNTRAGAMAETFQASLGLHKLGARAADVCALVWSEGHTYIAHDTHNDPKCPQSLLTLAIRYYAGAPIRVRGAIVGAVVAMDIVPHTQTSLEQRNTLESVARIAAEVLEERTTMDNNPVDGARPTGDSMVMPDEIDDDTVLLDDELTKKEAEMQRATLHQSARSNLMLLAVSRQSNGTSAFDAGIHSAMLFYRALLRSAWELEREEDGTRLFSFEERYQRGYLKATKVLSLADDGKVDWNKVLDLRHGKVYGDVIESVTSRKMINLHTTLDVVRFHPGTLWRSTKDAAATHLLCHRRQYPGGAWTMIAVDASDMQFCFAWLISPHAVDQVLVSVIVPHVGHHVAALLVALLCRVQQVTENMGDLRLSSCSGTADILEHRPVRAYSCSVLPAHPTTHVPGGFPGAAPPTTVQSQFWDLLGKTILTQQLLSQQQTSMMQTLEENAVKLKRLSNAVDRVESLLDRHNL